MLFRSGRASKATSGNAARRGSFATAHALFARVIASRRTTACVRSTPRSQASGTLRRTAKPRRTRSPRAPSAVSGGNAGAIHATSGRTRSTRARTEIRRPDALIAGPSVDAEPSLRGDAHARDLLRHRSEWRRFFRGTVRFSAGRRHGQFGLGTAARRVHGVVAGGPSRPGRNERLAIGFDMGQGKSRPTTTCAS